MMIDKNAVRGGNIVRRIFRSFSRWGGPWHTVIALCSLAYGARLPFKTVAPIFWPNWLWYSLAMFLTAEAFHFIFLLARQSQHDRD
jgi:hypothetical protein